MKELLHCPLFEGVSESELSAVIACLGARRMSYARGEAIYSEGDPARSIGILISGNAQVIREDYFGNRSILARIEPPDLFAEIFVCAETDRMPVTVIATEDCKALLIDGYRLLHTCGHACAFHQQMIFNLMKILARKNLLFHQKIEITSRRTTREKLMTYLLLQAKQQQSSRFEIPYDRQELADYLEVDRSGLSAEISRLRREGVIECSRNRFRLLENGEKEEEAWPT